MDGGAAEVTASSPEMSVDGIPTVVPEVSGTRRYLPALDGLRAFAVAGVVAYHFGYTWADGGYLGVDLFFVLSGFLITGLLAGEWRSSGGVALGGFWGRRVRRLLPAVLLLVLVLTLYDWLGGPNIGGSTFRPDAIATVFYSANWHLIATHQSYFTQYVIPSPLKHTWSLAIEEQFYLVWPLVLVAVGGLVGWRRRGAHRAGRTAVPALATVAASDTGERTVLAPAGPGGVGPLGGGVDLGGVRDGRGEVGGRGGSDRGGVGAGTGRARTGGGGTGRNSTAGTGSSTAGAGIGKARLFPRRAVLVVTVVLAVASALEMALMAQAGVDVNRIYYGTDTRAFELLIGAVLALVIVGRPDHTPASRRALHLAGPVAAVALGTLWVTAGDDQGNPSAWMYRGGMALAGVLAAVVIASVAQPEVGPLGTLLSLRPLRWIGRISYGLYLWHWPVYVLMTDLTTGLTGTDLLLARLGATLAAATTSFYLVERPIRRYRWRGWPLAVSTVSAVALTAVLVVVGTTSEATPGGTPDYASVAVVSPTATPDPLPAPITLPTGTVISPSHPLRVLTIGDSVMYDAEPGVKAALQATGVATVFMHGYPGWSLTTDKGWRTELPQVIAQDRPQVIIAMWSYDDTPAEAHPKAYRRLLDEFVNVVLSPGNGVGGIAFLHFPDVGLDPSFLNPTARSNHLRDNSVGFAAWSAMVAKLPAEYPGRITYIDSEKALDLDGKYSPWLPTITGGWIRVRKTDNTHLCPAGAAVFGAFVTSELRPMFSLPPPKAGWINASWTSDPNRYAVPPDQCPNDQPPS